MTSGRQDESAPADPHWRPFLAEAVLDSLSGSERVLTGSEDGIALIGPDQRFAYANPAACQLLGRPLDQLQGRDFLTSMPAPSYEAAGGLPALLGQAGVPFACVVRQADGAGREIACSTFAVELGGSPHWVAVFRDLSGPLAGAAAQPVTGIIEETLADIVHRAVTGTRGLTAGVSVVDDDHKLAAVGGYGFPEAAANLATWNTASIMLEDLPGGDGLFRNRPVVLPGARVRWEAHPVLAVVAATLTGIDWRSMVYVPLWGENRALGVLTVHLPSELDGPSKAELALYTALAGRAAIVVTIARLAASLERPARRWSPPLSMPQDGPDQNGQLSHAVAQLADLAQGAMAEMRALILELRPAALAEEGLLAALRTQAAALTAREGLAITVDGPREKLELGDGTDEHLYRIVLEALHNIVKHARASRADVRVTTQGGGIQVVVSDDGNGFDPEAERAGHLGLSTMADRARVIGAELTVTSAPGAGATVTLVLPHHRKEASRHAR